MPAKTESKTAKTKYQINPDININDLAETYPEVVEVLVNEYGFHCIGCFASQFETLQTGARVHGIKDVDFDELLARLQKIIDEAV